MENTNMVKFYQVKTSGSAAQMEVHHLMVFPSRELLVGEGLGYKDISFMSRKNEKI